MVKKSEKNVVVKTFRVEHAEKQSKCSPDTGRCRCVGAAGLLMEPGLCHHLVMTRLTRTEPSFITARSTQGMPGTGRATDMP